MNEKTIVRLVSIITLIPTIFLLYASTTNDRYLTIAVILVTITACIGLLCLLMYTQIPKWLGILAIICVIIFCVSYFMIIY